MTSPGYLAEPARERQIDKLLDWVTELRRNAAAMPWAEPPGQPDPFDRRDQAEAEEFAVIMARRQGAAA